MVLDPLEDLLELDAFDDVALGARHRERLEHGVHDGTQPRCATNDTQRAECTQAANRFQGFCPQ